MSSRTEINVGICPVCLSPLYGQSSGKGRPAEHEAMNRASSIALIHLDEKNVIDLTTPGGLDIAKQIISGLLYDIAT